MTSFDTHNELYPSLTPKGNFQSYEKPYICSKIESF